MAEVPAIIGVVGGLVGILGGGAAFYDRFYKGRPIASLTTANSSGRTLVQVRIKNTTSYDVIVTKTTERRGIHFLSEDSDTRSILQGQLDRKMVSFILKPNESKELLIMPKFEGGVAVEALRDRYVEFWIYWRRGNATWQPQLPIPVCTTTGTIRRLGGVA